MDALKVQTEILKKAYKGNLMSMVYGIWDDEHIGVIPDGHYMVLIPNKSFFLDIKAIWGGKSPFKLDSFKSSTRDSHHMEDTKTTKSVDKGTVRIIKDGDEEIWLDEKILKIFDKDCTFEGINGKSPVFIYEDGILMGMVLPIKHNQGVK